MNIKTKNKVTLMTFCLCVGGFAGAVIWTFLKIVAEGTRLLWEWIPAQAQIPYYTLLVCACGGLAIGLCRKRFGDYPEELEVVIGKVKREKHYEYRNMMALIVSALLPLLIGSSVGPEAGMTGIIVGICCWVGDNLKFAGRHMKEYSQVGIAVTLGVLFYSPLFGIFAVEEEGEGTEVLNPSKSSKILFYGLALGAATGIYFILTAFFGAAMEGFPSFEAAEAGYRDYLMMLVYMIGGFLLALFYEATHKGAAKVMGKLPPVLRETAAGVCLGVIGMLVPAMMFSGEEQMGELMTAYVRYAPLALVGVAFLKVFLTNLCIQGGLKGGHFFPVIFAGVCLGYGIAMFVFPEGGHEVFGAAVVTSALLGGIMRKPLAVTRLLFLCFPVRMFLWIFLAALIGMKGMAWFQKMTKADHVG